MNMLSVPNYNRLGRLVDELMESAQSHSKSGFRPACEIKESAKSYIINFEIPGVDASKVNIEVAENNLLISGEKESLKSEEDLSAVFNECSYGKFQRNFSLPEDADPEDIKATFKNGVLSINISKAPLVEPRKVKIEVTEQ